MSSPLRTLHVSPATSEVIKTDHHPAPSEWSPRGPVPFSASILWAVQDFTSTKENGPVQWATKVSTISTTVLEIPPTTMKV